MNLFQMSDIDLSNKKVLIRADLNVPINNGKITNNARILATLPTIKTALQTNTKIMIMSHLGRPKEGMSDNKLSLQPIADALSHLLKRPIPLIKDWINGNFDLSNHDIVLLENVRFLSGELTNDTALSQKIAKLCDVFIMDAFGTAHRAHASTCGVGYFTKLSCAGLLMMQELNALTKALKKPDHPICAIIGGSKVSSKLKVLESLTSLCDHIIVGGGIANTFLMAAGFNIGSSIYEKNLINTAKALLKKTNIILPKDVICAKELSQNTQAQEKSINQVQKEDMILDVGTKTSQLFQQIIQTSNTILWNGPVGVFEIPQFSRGTKALSLDIAQSKAFSIAGGGDTLAAIDQYHIHNQISYTSTGGGAFLEFLEGKTLPTITMLQTVKKSNSQL